jgi:dTDP-glucose 4,6-dehydratase
VLDLARTIVSLTWSRSEVVFIERPVDDPEIRCPDISRARAELGWEPSIPLVEGLQRTIDWARTAWRA